MSMISPIDHDLYLVYSKLLPVPFRQFLLEQNVKLLEVPDAEYKSMGCNVLAVAPRKCIMIDGNTETKNRLEAEGVEIHPESRNCGFESRATPRQDEEVLKSLYTADQCQNQNELQLTEHHGDVDAQEFLQSCTAVDGRRLIHTLRDAAEAGIVDEDLETAHKGETHAGHGEQGRVRIGQPAACPVRQPHPLQQSIQQTHVREDHPRPDQLDRHARHDDGCQEDDAIQIAPPFGGEGVDQPCHDKGEGQSNGHRNQGEGQHVSQRGECRRILAQVFGIVGESHEAGTRADLELVRGSHEGPGHRQIHEQGEQCQ